MCVCVCVCVCVCEEGEREGGREVNRLVRHIHVRTCISNVGM